MTIIGEQPFADEQLVPQNTAILSPEAFDDPRTITQEVDGRVEILLTPIEYATELNQPLFEKAGRPAYFLNPSISMQPDALRRALETMPAGSLVASEYLVRTGKELNPFFDACGEMGRGYALFADACDPDSGEVSIVQHYLSDIQKPQHEGLGYQTMDEAYQSLVDDGSWQQHAKRAVKYLAGPEISPEVAAMIWDAYSNTFDILTRNHPSAQKEPPEYFMQQLFLPGSKVVYVENGEGQIASVAFCMENIEDCPWLDEAYFKSVTPSGRALFFPGIATAVDSEGKPLNGAAAFSPRLIRAFAHIVSRTDTATVAATQCTNISQQYIPHLMNRFTQPYVTLDMQETYTYAYPVYELTS